MEQETNFIVYDGIEVPVSPLLKREQVNKYGSVPGLEDEELADPDEIERQVIREEFEPVLLLPVRPRRSTVTANLDEDGQVDWGAFGTVDFDRYRQFDKARYKADKLREEFKNLLLLIDISKSHVPGNAKYLVLKHLERGVIDIDHIDNIDMLILARQYLRAKRLQKQISELERSSWRRREEGAVARKVMRMEKKCPLCGVARSASWFMASHCLLCDKLLMDCPVDEDG